MCGDWVVIGRWSRDGIVSRLKKFRKTQRFRVEQLTKKGTSLANFIKKGTSHHLRGLEGRGDVVPDDGAGTGVAEGDETGDLAGDDGETGTLGTLGRGEAGAALVRVEDMEGRLAGALGGAGNEAATVAGTGDKA